MRSPLRLPSSKSASQLPQHFKVADLCPATVGDFHPNHTRDFILPRATEVYWALTPTENRVHPFSLGTWNLLLVNLKNRPQDYLTAHLLFSCLVFIPLARNPESPLRVHFFFFPSHDLSA